jgi:hypothetical protein
LGVEVFGVRALRKAGSFDGHWQDGLIMHVEKSENWRELARIGEKSGGRILGKSREIPVAILGNSREFSGILAWREGERTGHREFSIFDFRFSIWEVRGRNVEHRGSNIQLR